MPRVLWPSPEGSLCFTGPSLCLAFLCAIQILPDFRKLLFLYWNPSVIDEQGTTKGTAQLGFIFCPFPDSPLCV